MASNDAAPGPFPSAPSASTTPSAPAPPGRTAPGRGTRGLSRRRALALPPAIAALVALGGCGVFGGSARAQAYDTDAVHREIPLEDAPGAPDAAAACAALSESLLRFRLGEEPAANALTCPVGTALTIALLYAGSDAPADGVDSLLGVSAAKAADADSGTTRDLTWSALQNALLAYDPSDEELNDFDPEQIPEAPLLHIANRVLLVGDDPAVEQSYLDAAREWYAATTEHADRDDAKAALDAWAERHTGGLIKSSGIEITKDTRLVLQNALLFAARWSTTFDANHTYDQDFTLADGSTVTARLMHEDFFRPCVQGEGWQAVRLPYWDGDDDAQLVMDVILPDAGVAPTDLPEGAWEQASAALDAVTEDRRSEVVLALPTFDLKPGPVDLLAFLDAQGTTLDSLEHIGEDLVVDQAVQQVRLMVKEEGTVAGALTELSGAGAAAPPEAPVQFIVDHPFALRIVDQLTGLVLIEGVIMDPTAAAE
ncbi:serpin family protein [Actinomyces glycerinitolerans]|uniref:Serpin (Serine protease inhibitor) n=1 Tax=Actinomyces glycerinitolerans TaxID=1892869 RepID=A0A1M4S3T4_9ACTO|nr:serpin family protein [Actinomyces glycerinitolerans]SHE26848.1 serpin (serine protease inhibitor) [Actinomyces glycerinitolerans]